MQKAFYTETVIAFGRSWPGFRLDPVPLRLSAWPLRLSFPRRFLDDAIHVPRWRGAMPLRLSPPRQQLGESQNALSLRHKVETLCTQLRITKGATLAETVDRAVRELGMESSVASLNLMQKVDACLATVGLAPSVAPGGGGGPARGRRNGARGPRPHRAASGTPRASTTASASPPPR